jgi:hypothetical protein
MKKNFFLIGIMAVLIFTHTVEAKVAGEGGHVGGGDATASDFQDFINKIDTYLLTPEGRAEFPEIKQPEFHNIAKQVRPVVKDERVFDSFGVAQTCISSVAEGNRFFQCDLKRLPKVEINNQPTFYRITFHELLFQVRLELPISRDVPSDFRISSRLKLYLETYQEWVPGETAGAWRDPKFPQGACQIDIFDKPDTQAKTKWVEAEHSELNAIECLVKAYDLAEKNNKIDIEIDDKKLNLIGKFKIRK